MMIYSVYFPEFVPLVPKKSKRCKTCKKFIVQAEEVTKKQPQKLELCHLFLNQLPCMFIFKVDKAQSILLLKFAMLDFKETKISFKKCEDFGSNVILPTGTYEISENTDNTTDTDEFVYYKADRVIVMNFAFTPDTSRDCTIIKFIIKAEYDRLVLTHIEYAVEIKLKN